MQSPPAHMDKCDVRVCANRSHSHSIKMNFIEIYASYYHLVVCDAYQLHTYKYLCTTAIHTYVKTCKVYIANVHNHTKGDKFIVVNAYCLFCSHMWMAFVWIFSQAKSENEKQMIKTHQLREHSTFNIYFNI